jgi:hypothetical protein
VALTLKKEIYSLLSCYNLDIQNIRGQGYDGASNMRGESNGLQALISHDCPYAYYIHCFAHRLQLALVAASKAVTLYDCTSNLPYLFVFSICLFFFYMTCFAIPGAHVNSAHICGQG